MLEISSKECKIDSSDSDDSQTFPRNNMFDKSVKDIESESVSSGDVTAMDKTNNDGSTEANLEELLIDMIDISYMKTEPIQEGPKTPWPGPGSLTAGLLFPDYDSMTTSLDEWSRANFSPLVKASSGGIGPGSGPRAFHTFRCPHKKAKARQGQSQGLGIRRQKANVIEYVDCPFLVDTKVNPDGSCVVTRALTEHSGHPVSEEQFQKYRRL